MQSVRSLASIAHRNHLYIDVFLHQDMPKRLLHARFLIPSGNYNADARSMRQGLSKQRQSLCPSQAIQPLHPPEQEDQRGRGEK